MGEERTSSPVANGEDRHGDADPVYKRALERRQRALGADPDKLSNALVRLWEPLSGR
jgi:hypothetical protein